MRFRTVVVALCSSIALLAGSAAQASQVNMVVNREFPNMWGVAPGELIDVELYLDATETGIQLLAVGLLWPSAVFQYNPQSLAATGVPTYILYGGSGMQMSSLYAQQDPWLIWPGTKPAGMEQVNINWADPSFTGTFVTGLGIKIAGIQLQVIAPGDGLGEIVLSSTSAGAVFQVNGATGPLPTSGSFAVITPEPTTALLVGLGLAGLGVAGRRRKA